MKSDCFHYTVYTNDCITHTALKCKFTKEERELRGRYKLLARLMDAEDIKKEKQLRQRIKELSRCRKNG